MKGTDTDILNVMIGQIDPKDYVLLRGSEEASLEEPPSFFMKIPCNLLGNRLYQGVRTGYFFPKGGLSMEIKERVRAMEDELVELRRYFHAHPEPSWKRI